MLQAAATVEPERRALVRDVNTRVRGCVDSLVQAPNDWYELLCECGRLGCRARVRVRRVAFAALLPDRGRFLVAPGHESGPDDVVAAAPGR